MLAIDFAKLNHFCDHLLLFYKQEVEGRPLRLNLAAERARSPPTIEANTVDNLDSSELLSSIGS